MAAILRPRRSRPRLLRRIDRRHTREDVLGHALEHRRIPEQLEAKLHEELDLELPKLWHGYAANYHGQRRAVCC